MYSSMNNRPDLARILAIYETDGNDGRFASSADGQRILQNYMSGTRIAMYCLAIWKIFFTVWFIITDISCLLFRGGGVAITVTRVENLTTLSIKISR